MPTPTTRGEAALKDACFRLLQAEVEEAEEALGVAAWKVGPYVHAGMVEDELAVRLLVAAGVTAGVSEDFVARRIIELTFQRATRSPDGGGADGPHGAALTSPGRRLHTASDWAGLAVPERVWTVHGWIPAATTTVFYGDGGTGKSLLAQQLAVAAATDGGSWMGLSVRRSAVLGLFCEEDAAEMMRRQAAICARAGIDARGLEDLRIMCAAGEANLLMTFDARGVGELTAFGHEWFALAEAGEPGMIIIDTAADTFGGNENSRLEVRQFISALNALALKTGAAVILLAHPSIGGMTNGRGHSGSTAWTNGARSHLYLSRPEVDEDDGEAEADLRLLARRKANYGPGHDSLRLVWRGGAFALERPPARWS